MGCCQSKDTVVESNSLVAQAKKDEIEPKKKSMDVAVSPQAVSSNPDASNEEPKESLPGTKEQIPDSTTDPNEGKKFVADVKSRYEKTKRLGTGGYGSVFQVKDIASGVLYAMKFMPRLRNGSDYGEKFWAEVEVLKSLDHPSVLKYVDAFYNEEGYYLITELLTGGELLDYILKMERFSERDASRVLRSMFEVVRFLHTKKVCHLDLKPENFVFSMTEEEAGQDQSKSRVLKLIDFGCAKHLEDSVTCNVRTGTPYYIAPGKLIFHKNSNFSMLTF